MSWWRCKPEQLKEEPKIVKFWWETEILRLRSESNWYKAQLFDAWKCRSQQQKGMRRMARKIKRLRREVQTLKEATHAD